MSRPTTTLVRRGELVAWLAGHGISERQVRNIVAANRITKCRIRDGGHAYFLVAEVEEKVLGPLLGRAGR